MEEGVLRPANPDGAEQKPAGTQNEPQTLGGIKNDVQFESFGGQAAL